MFVKRVVNLGSASIRMVTGGSWYRVIDWSRMRVHGVVDTVGGSRVSDEISTFLEIDRVLLFGSVDSGALSKVKSTFFLETGRIFFRKRRFRRLRLDIVDWGAHLRSYPYYSTSLGDFLIGFVFVHCHPLSMVSDRFSRNYQA